MSLFPRPGRIHLWLTAFAAVGALRAEAPPLRLKTAQAEFQVLPTGRILAFRLEQGRRISLDAPVDPADKGTQAVVLGKVRVLNAGHRLELPCRRKDGLKATWILEVRDDAPTALFASMRVTNPGRRAARLKELEVLRSDLAPGRRWSFEGASLGWGLDEVRELRPGKRLNPMGSMAADGVGGGIPLNAFWGATGCMALGCLSNAPCTLPVAVADDGNISATLAFPARRLAAGGTWTSPWGILAVHEGDFFEPVKLWARLMGGSAWPSARPSAEAHKASWCSWGYGFDITPAQMIGAIPKLKELGLSWATLDDRWFDAYGDWKPRKETFPGDAMKDMVATFHRAGLKVQLWWLPIAAELPNGKGESHRYRQSDVVRDHPEWLVLDPKGQPATMIRSLGVLDPSLPEVQAYFRDLAVKFIRDDGFDGFKMDNVFAVPPCFNPKHHHGSPQESVQGAGELYRIILEATHALKPGAVIQICPCGTTPAVDWLPWMDQAVTADPVGAVQVRRRIKLYKALLGPTAAVYGDHVELSAMAPQGEGDWLETGEDFASTIGAGGVVGTKFVWPPLGVVPKSGPVDLTPEKDAVWRKWIGLHNAKRLSSGTFLNLYTLGVDVPEGYAIRRDGKLHYAFFAEGPWQGEVELRGLPPGSYRVRDYAEDRDLGPMVAEAGKAPRLAVAFKDHLLLEVTP
jgi:alpha-galactosidase